jgi:lysophospholipase L1-like esterase
MKKAYVWICISIFLLLFGALYSVLKLHFPSALSSFIDFSQSTLDHTNEKDRQAIALGDSLAYGIGDTTDNGYIGDIKKRYEKSTGERLTIKDFGVPDDTSTDLIRRLQNNQITDSADQSDFILINIGTNDFLKTTEHLTKFDEKELKKNQEIYKRNLSQILRYVQDAKSPKPVYVLGIYNPKVKGTDMSSINKVVRNWNESTIQVTKSHRYAIFVRTDDLFMNINKQDYFSDALHPNKKGYALIGKRVSEMVIDNHKHMD